MKAVSCRMSLPPLSLPGVRTNPEERGVIPNSFDHIFTHIARTENKKFLVRASYLEIYQVRAGAGRELVSHSQAGLGRSGYIAQDARTPVLC